MTPPISSKRKHRDEKPEIHRVICQGNSRMLAMSSFLDATWINVQIRALERSTDKITLEVTKI